MGIREHFSPKHLLSKTCKRKANTDWLVWLLAPTLIGQSDADFEFPTYVVKCRGTGELKKGWMFMLIKTRPNSLYSEDILLFLKLELIRSIFTSVKKRKNYEGGMLESLAFPNFWFSLYPTKRHRNWLDTSTSLFPITSTIFVWFRFLREPEGHLMELGVPLVQL